MSDSVPGIFKQEDGKYKIITKVGDLYITQYADTEELAMFIQMVMKSLSEDELKKLILDPVKSKE